MSQDNSYHSWGKKINDRVTIFENEVFLTDRMTVKFCVLAIWCWTHESTPQRCSFKTRLQLVVFKNAKSDTGTNQAGYDKVKLE